MHLSADIQATGRAIPGGHGDAGDRGRVYHAKNGIGSF